MLSYHCILLLITLVLINVVYSATDSIQFNSTQYTAISHFKSKWQWGSIPVLTDDQETNTVCIRAAPIQLRPLARRYDISDMGYWEMFRGWVDIQGSGAANDYCRFVGSRENIHLSCALAGTHGESENNYQSEIINFDRGYANTWYMKDEDGDGRDDYCRCVGKGDTQQVVCTKAGPKGFHGSVAQGGKTLTFTPTGPLACEKRQVRPEFGRVYGFV